MHDTIKYRHTEDMGEISGHGGAYEEQCQIMLAAGARFVLAHDNELNLRFVDTGDGLIAPDHPHAERLWHVLLASVDNNCTIAMVKAVINRLQYINQNGWEKYRQALLECTPEEETDPIDDPQYHVE